MRRFDFAVGRTNPETFPVDRVQRAASTAIANEYAQLTEYPGKLGHPGLRTVMARRESEREGVEVDPDALALMNGSMQAVTLTAEALTRPGDTVICEEVTYSGTIGAYRTLGIDMVGIGVDEDGMRVELLEETLDELGEARKPKFIYALTTYQNPTGTNLSLERRHRLIDIARARDIPIIEDNCYGDGALRRRQAARALWTHRLREHHLHVLAVEDPRAGHAPRVPVRSTQAARHHPRPSPRRRRQLPRGRGGRGTLPRRRSGRLPRS